MKLIHSSLSSRQNNFIKLWFCNQVVGVKVKHNRNINMWILVNLLGKVKIRIYMPLKKKKVKIFGVTFHFDRIPNLQKSLRLWIQWSTIHPLSRCTVYILLLLIKKWEFWISYLRMKTTTRRIKFGWYKL